MILVRTRSGLAVLAVAAAALGGAVPRLVVDSPPAASLSSALAERPLALEARRDGFLARGSGYNALLRPDSQLVALHRPFRLERDAFGHSVLPRTAPEQAGFTVRFLGAHANAKSVATRPLAPVDYVRRAETRTAPTFAQVVFRSVYTGVDLSYHGRGGRLQADWLVAPRADPRQIRLGLAGVDRVTRRADGSVVLDVKGLRAILTRPVAFQEGRDTRRSVTASWLVQGRTLAFALGAYDSSLPLVIDPKLETTVTVGGNDIDTLIDVDADSAGNLVAVGATVESQFPRVGTGTFQPGGNFDGVVVTLSPALQVIGTTVLGGLRDDIFQRIDAGDPGEWIVSGWTTSANFPTPHALDSTYGGGECAEAPCVDGLLLGFQSGTLRFGTYVGGARDDQVTSIAIDRTARNGNGVLVFGGFSNSVEFVRSAGYDEFVGTIDYEALESLSAGSSYRLQLFGGAGNDSINDVAIRGNLVYAVGGSRSTAQLAPGTPLGFQNAFILYSRDGGSTWAERVYASPTPFSAFDAVRIDADGSAYAAFLGFFPGGNYGSCTFGTCQPAGFVKLDAAAFAPGPVATLVPPPGGRFSIQDLATRRSAAGAIEVLGAAVNSFESFSAIATPTGAAVLVRPGPDVSAPTELPKGALAWGAEFMGDSLFLAGVALDESFTGVHGEADGFVSKVGDLGLAPPCACTTVSTAARAVRATRKAVSFMLDWTLTCTGGSGSCDGELAIEPPRGVRISRPKQHVRCGPGQCTTAPQRGSFRVAANVTTRTSRVTFVVRKWCGSGAARKALPAVRVSVPLPRR